MTQDDERGGHSTNCVTKAALKAQLRGSFEKGNRPDHVIGLKRSRHDGEINVRIAWKEP